MLLTTIKRINLKELVKSLKLESKRMIEGPSYLYDWVIISYNLPIPKQ